MLTEDQKAALLTRLVAGRARELVEYADPNTAVAGVIKFAPMLDDMAKAFDDAEAAYVVAMNRARELHDVVMARLRSRLADPKYVGMSAERLCEALLERERVPVPGRAPMQGIIESVLARIPIRPADLLVTDDGHTNAPLLQQMLDAEIAKTGKTRDELMVREDAFVEVGQAPWVSVVDGIPYARNVPKIDLIREALDGR